MKRSLTDSERQGGKVSIFDSIKVPCESLYDKKADVYVYKKAEGVINNTYESLLYENVPCRISISSSQSGTQTDKTDDVSQSIKLFCSSKWDIPAGAKVVVDSEVFKSAGISAKYISHQEINLVNEKVRA